MKANSKQNNLNKSMKPSQGNKQKEKITLKKAQTLKRAKKINSTFNNEDTITKPSNMSNFSNKNQPKQINTLVKMNSSNNILLNHEIKKNKMHKLTSKVKKPRNETKSRG